MTTEEASAVTVRHWVTSLPGPSTLRAGLALTKTPATIEAEIANASTGIRSPIPRERAPVVMRVSFPLFAILDADRHGHAHNSRVSVRVTTWYSHLSIVRRGNTIANDKQSCDLACNSLIFQGSEGRARTTVTFVIAQSFPDITHRLAFREALASSSLGSRSASR